MKRPLSMMPLLPVAVSLVGGITAVGLCSHKFGIFISAAAFIAASLCLLCRKREPGILLLAATVGAIAATVADPRGVADAVIGKELTATADIISASESGTSQVVTARLVSATDSAGNTAAVSGMKASIIYTSFNPTLKPGQRITFRSRFEGCNATLSHPEEYDPTAGLRRHNVWLRAMVFPEKVIALGDAAGLRAAAARANIYLAEIVGACSLKPSTKEFLTTAILGDASAIPDETRSNFSRAGLAHLLALSGLHVGIITSLLALLLLPLRFSSLRRLIAPLTIIALWAFAIVTGCSPSVTRSVIMATVIISALAIERRHSATNSLCLAAILILIVDPFAIKTISFQLSFLAVAGILIFSQALNPISRRNRIGYAAMAMITVTMSAMLATAIVSIHYFNTFPVLFLLSNIIVAPILPPLIGCGVLTIALKAVGVDFNFLCTVTDALCDLLFWISSAISSLPFATIDNIHLSTPVVIFASLAIIAFGIAINTRTRLSIAATTTFALCALVMQFLPAEQKFDMSPILLSSPARTEILLASGSELKALTTASQVEHPAVAEEIQRRFAAYMGRRGLRNVAVSSLSANSLLSNNILTHRNTRMLIAADSLSLRTAAATQINYLLITARWHGNIESLIARLGSDITILIGADVHHLTRQKILTLATTAGLTAHDLSATPFQPFNH